MRTLVLLADVALICITAAIVAGMALGFVYCLLYVTKLFASIGSAM